MPGRLVIFCGIPGSGKTTIARKVAAQNEPSVHLQTDAIRAMIPRPTYSAEESEFVYDACLAAAREALDSGYFVILDGTFGSSRRREAALSALAGHYTSAEVVHVVCDLETALRRNSERLRVVPEDRLKGILAAFEAPVGAITIDTSTTPPEDASLKVVRTLVYPLVPPE